MRLLVFCLLWISSTSCSVPVDFDRNNQSDPGSSGYMPPKPIRVDLYRSDRQLELTWILLDGGVDRLRFEKSTDGITFTPVGLALPTDPRFVDTTDLIAYPMSYRVRSEYEHRDGLRVSEPYDLPLPNPVGQAPPGSVIGSFQNSSRLITGQILGYRTLYGFRFRFTDESRAVSEYYPEPRPAYPPHPAESTGDLSVYHNVFVTRDCPMTVSAVLELYLPLASSDVKIAEYPLQGSPFTIQCE